MEQVIIPQLYYSFPSAINPDVETARKHTDEWVKKYRLYTDKDYKKYLDDNLAYLTSRFYATATCERLCIANDAFVLLFVIDDLLDNQVERTYLIQEEQSLQTFVNRFSAILDGDETISAGKDEHILAALTDLWSRLKQISTKEWLTEFAKSLKKLFEMALWEFHNANNHELPGVEKYLKRRQFLGAAHISTDLIEPIEQIYLSRPVLQHGSVQALTETGRNIICLANDLFSLSKEISHGDEHNIVPVIQNQYDLTFEEAIAQAAELHNDQMHKFIKLREELPSFGEETDKELQRYAQALATQMQGNVDFSESETQRYSFSYEEAQSS